MKFCILNRYFFVLDLSHGRINCADWSNDDQKSQAYCCTSDGCLMVVNIDCSDQSMMIDQSAKVLWCSDPESQELTSLAVNKSHCFVAVGDAVGQINILQLINEDN